MKMSPLFLLILGVSGVYSDSHTLRYYNTGVSGTGSGLPEFSIAGYVDDQQIVNYNSDSHLYRPVAPWMDKEGPEYWERETQKGKGTEPVFKAGVRILMNRFNQTGGFHSWQWMYGCELRDDGSTAGYDQYGYDGRDFTYLDTERGVYISTTHEGQITTQKWNSPDVREGERQKNYLENLCIESLKRYIINGRDDLERRVRPDVKVSGHQSGDITKLQCLVYGFHPRDVDVKWMRNGRDEVPSDEVKQILPNPDGTYQTRVTVEVIPRDGDSYSCYVDHSSLEETLNVLWEPKDNSSSYVIIGVIIAAILVVVIAGIVLFVVFRKRSGKKPGNVYVPASNKEDDSSNSSGN
ncbi:class I histocompatibility antigen, F10 alpha chain-like [Mixophyes fleayi]|uniref:class I histocompatibility antigen, F10 alpha chain-like n=1 Tax=Mixophyes fleayi TaxID=3061075 RepID=UPI003F4E3573